MERIPSTRETARRLGLVTLPEMVAALVHAVENPPDAIRIVPVDENRAARHLLAESPAAGRNPAASAML